MALLGALKINLVTCVRESLVLSFYDRDLFARSVASNTKQNWRCGHAATTSFEDSERWVHPGPCANSPPAIKNLVPFLNIERSWPFSSRFLCCSPRSSSSHLCVDNSRLRKIDPGIASLLLLRPPSRPALPLTHPLQYSPRFLNLILVLRHSPKSPPPGPGGSLSGLEGCKPRGKRLGLDRLIAPGSPLSEFVA